MKFFHTADWHLGKLVQGVYMTEDQKYILEQFLKAIEEEKPDAVIIAGDLYDRAVPPTEAVQLLTDVLETIVLDLNTPVLAIAGNHDSPSRLNFVSKITQRNGLHIIGNFTKEIEPIVLEDEHGEVHFHLVPYADPSVVRTAFDDEEIRSHNDAAKKIVETIKENRNEFARHVYVGHAFVTPMGEEEPNTSESERPLSIGGAEYVDAHHFTDFHYTALGHLHQAHKVLQDNIRYAGSPMKYSISEEHHNKVFYVVEMDGEGNVSLDKRSLTPRRDIRTVEATIDDLMQHPVNEDYVFVKLLDETPVLSPMEKVRSVYPNAMHVERKNYAFAPSVDGEEVKDRSKMSELDLFKAFYKEVKGEEAKDETENLFKEVLDELLTNQRETQTDTKQKEFVRN
ncbi:exonuclease SbcCD subunit D [Ornithinibacillus halotolerans]|uniref:Nuclease SbcCD subunit D n=1 Tax=Ornithinibacillus halotolerans TaxID=1274357 RepID=A0A916S213_9BACI|nr:exonuclease SbcCD subunit D [Ornithinibacillus halotolerans]GGA79985.1 nuclease SbcCD subunit D [Ornithinibacillus halotolerans]